MSRVLVATGMLCWDGYERQTKKYAAFGVEQSGYKETAKIPAMFNKPLLDSYSGKKVKLTAVVRETNNSDHVGDKFLFYPDTQDHIKPSTPNLGDTIVIGIGVISLKKANSSFDNEVINLQVEDRPDDLFQIDPEILYRLHEQVIDLYLEETDEPSLPRTKLILDTDPNRAAAVASDDKGTYVQLNRVFDESSKPLKIAPVMKKLGKGLFSIESPKVGDNDLRVVE